MREKIQIVLAAFILLAIGMGLGFWLALRRPLPPPAWIAERPPHEGRARPSLTPAQIEHFYQRLQEIAPDVRAFQERFTAIESEFRTQFVALLTDAQRAGRPDHPMAPVDWVGDFDRLAAGHIGLSTPSFSPSQEKSSRFYPQEGRALFTLLRIVMYEPSFRIATDRYQLTPDQQARLRVLLEERRKAVLEVMDAHPLPLDRLFFLMRDLGMFREGAKRRQVPSSATP